MTILLITFGLVFVGLAVVIAIVTGWGQGYFYETVVEGLTWRSAALAGGVTAFLGLWTFVEMKSPGKFDSLFNFSARDDKWVPYFWAERKGTSGTVETKFNRRGMEYFDDGNRSWRRSDANGIVTAIIIEENGEKRKFVAKLGPDGKFLVDPRNRSQVADVQYVEEGGQHRVMTEGMMGRLTTTRTGAVLLNVLFNLVFLLVWFAGLWFLMEFQWPHALLLAALFWLTSVMLLWPAIQGQIPRTLPG
ncbi:MAG: hypothetical protein ACJ8C4_14645 [Gemmataceae bacterium]